jgi:hypothetical protein
MIKIVYYIGFVAVVFFVVFSVVLDIWSYLTTGELTMHDNASRYKTNKLNKKLSQGQLIVLKIVIASRKTIILLGGLIITYNIILLIINRVNL